MIGKKLIEHDGNGSIKINTYLAIGTFLLLIFTALISVTVVVVSAQNNADISLQEIQEQKNIINTHSIDINEHENRIVRIETHYEHILESLIRIEGDIKQ